MVDKKETIENIKWIENRLQQLELTKIKLSHAIQDYLQYMKPKGYSDSTLQYYRRILNCFFVFVKSHNFIWDEIFTINNTKVFQGNKRNSYATVVRGFSQYLFEQKRIKQPAKRLTEPLPKIYEQYMSNYGKSRHACRTQITGNRKLLSALSNYLEKNSMKLSGIKIEQIDAFMAEYNANLAKSSSRLMRSYLRGFLKYLYFERGILKKNLAPLIVSAPLFGYSKPPKFLRPHEIQKLFAPVKSFTPVNLRTNAMLHLAYYMGLRPKEISLISLDDISFEKKQISLRYRKNRQPVILPLPENVIKSLAAYIIGGRPESKHRMVFLTKTAPIKPIKSKTVILYIKKLMDDANLPSTTYWLRHTYAQNLLVAGMSIFEIKEMMGHDTIESTRKYLYIDIKLMREILFDETI